MVKRIHVSKLRIGDLVRFGDGLDEVWDAFTDEYGTWIEWESGSLGYSFGYFTVVNY